MGRPLVLFSVRLLLACLGLVLVLSLSGLRPMVVLGASMQPALNPWEAVLLEGRYYRTHPVQAGDIVVFRWHGTTYVKRVHAVAGEKVPFICMDGSSWPLPIEQVAHQQRLAKGHPYISVHWVAVPAGHVFCLGDNLNASMDSRELGPIPVSAILGRVRSL
jgi:signal peptidase I